MTGKEKIDAIVKKWADKAWDENLPVPVDSAIENAVRETIAECSAIVDSMRGSGETDLRSVCAVVGGFERWRENGEEE